MRQWRNMQSGLSSSQSTLINQRRNSNFFAAIVEPKILLVLLDVTVDLLLLAIGA